MTARRGFALLYSLLLVLTASTLTAAMLAMGAREGVIARRYVEIVQARGAAEREAREVFRSWSTTAYRDLAVGGDRTLPGRQGHVLARVTRLGTTLFLISTEARMPAGPGPPVLARAGMLVRTLDHGGIESFFPGAAAASASAYVRGGRISGRDACRAEVDQRPGITVPDLSLHGTRIDGDPAVRLGAPAPPPPEWPLDFARAAVLADLRIDVSELAPRPDAVGGVCATGPSNWGALSPLHPCVALQQIIYAPGDLTVRGGEGRGILIVDGSLILGGGFEFHGLVLARGSVSLLPGATIRGALRAGTVRLEEAEVLLDRCAMRDALGSPALDRAYRPGERWWVPLF